MRTAGYACPSGAPRKKTALPVKTERSPVLRLAVIAAAAVLAAVLACAVLAVVLIIVLVAARAVLAVILVVVLAVSGPPDMKKLFVTGVVWLGK